MNSVHCSRCVCVCVHCSRCVCTQMGQIQRTHFTAGYTLYNYVCDKKKKLFFFTKPITINIGKPIYRSISNIYIYIYIYIYI